MGGSAGLVQDILPATAVPPEGPDASEIALGDSSLSGMNSGVLAPSLLPSAGQTDATPSCWGRGGVSNDPE